MFSDQRYSEVDVVHYFYQQAIAIYECRNRQMAQFAFAELRKKIDEAPPINELKQLGRTLKRKWAEITASLPAQAVSGGAVEATGGRLEFLRGIALGFRNMKHYILRCLLHSGQLQDKLKAL